MSVEDTITDTLTSEAEDLVGDLTDGLLDKATNLQDELIGLGQKISTDKIQSMLEGNIKDITSKGIEMLSKAGIGTDIIEKFKNKPTAILDSIMTSVDEKIESIKDPKQLLNNISSNLNINFSDMIKNANFKDVMSQVGVDTDMLESLDLTDVKSLDDLKENLTDSLSTEILDKIDNLGGMDNLIDKAVGGFDGLVKNFSIDKIKNTALSEISDKVPAKILSRFIN